MKDDELLEYSTIIQMMRAEIAAKDEALWTIAGATESEFDRKVIAELARNAMKNFSRRIDFVDIKPEEKEG